jgi:hypothetical protein
MKNLQITLAIGAISLAAAMSASAAIIITGSELDANNVVGSGTTTSTGTYVSYAVDNGNNAGYSSVSYSSSLGGVGGVSLVAPGNNSGHFAEVTVNSSVIGSP